MSNYNSSVHLTVNGEPKLLDNITTVSSLVEHLGLKPDRLAIELNLNIVPRTAWPTTQLNDGDKLEIVHFVGGG